MLTKPLFDAVSTKYPHQPLFQQAVKEFLDSIESYTAELSETERRRLERLLTPERVVSFRVTWEDDNGTLQYNTGYRVQFNSALGPYKGGLRFDPSVNEDVLKFLGFEQIFKNALTGLQLGGAKGGSDFDPKGKSEAEIRRFCFVFMAGLREHVGLEKDVPAGDIGVGQRELGYLFGAYKALTNTNEGVLTGKDQLFGGSCRRSEATGHGVVYFADAVARHHGFSLADQRVVISGAGNVAEHTARAFLDRGAIVQTFSDRGGYLFKERGFRQADIDTIRLQKVMGKNLDTIEIDGAEYHAGKPWSVPAVVYAPCATQNEVTDADVRTLIEHAKLIIEGANMPLTDEAVALVQASEVIYAPGKAANAGGVSVSGIEMAQNAGHYAWTCEQVENELKKIMEHIHEQCVREGQADGTVDYVRGANLAGAKRVMDAMRKLGW